MTDPQPSRILAEHVCNIALRAGEAILAIAQTRLDVAHKDDRSPVTAADRAANNLIVHELRALTPATTIVSEEGDKALDKPDGAFWLVDPLDGTREFIAGNGEYTVNIALINHHTPVLGVIHAPAIGRTFFSSGPHDAYEAFVDGTRKKVTARQADRSKVIAVASRSHLDPATEAYLKERHVVTTMNIGSSLKFCLIAAGEADLYPRFAPTMEWDTAAGHAILTAAGGTVKRTDGSLLEYSKSGFRNPHFIAQGPGLD